MAAGLGLAAASFGQVAVTPSNAQATKETRSLYAWLNGLSGRTVFGVSEEADTVFRDFGKRPALLGVEYYDYGPVERRLADREKAHAAMTAHCRAGGMVSLHDHMYNFGGVKSRSYAPKDNLGLRDRTVQPLPELLPGGRLAHDYRQYLRRMAAFMKSVQIDGVPCPILFRPYHEMNGRWFWWGGEENAENLVHVWRHTYNVLVQEEGVHHLLWIWSPSVARQKASAATFEKFWPGRSYVDIVGLDGYDNDPGGSFGSEIFRQSYLALIALAKRERVPFAWTEIGFADSGRNLPGFWMDNVLSRLRNDYPEAKYFMIWHGKWLPSADAPAGNSARDMVNDPYVLTLDRVNWSDVYGLPQ